MSETGSCAGGSRGADGAGAGSGAVGGAGPAAGGGGGAGRSLHARSFKLRFAANREQGRSYVSLVKPLALPATVTDKFYTRRSQGASGVSGVSAERASPEEESALRRIQDMFVRGPRDVYLAPVTTSHQYGWWCVGGHLGGGHVVSDRRLQHHIRDSAWLKARLLVLAADHQLNQR